MNSSRPKYEGWFYLLAFLIALAFRFIQLGATPLTDSEAELALQALRIAQGKEIVLGPQPAYILFTSVLFLVFEATNFMARFLPALLGSALVFAPWYFREKLKPYPALILAFLITFDPGLVAISRQASGTMLALTFLLFAWGMWRTQRAIHMGIFAALALLSGPSIWSGLLMLGLTLLLLLVIKPKSTAVETSTKNPESNIENDESKNINPESKFETRKAMVAFIATILLAGTLFFTTPNGLSAWAASLPAYLKGWTSPSLFTPGRMLFIFIVYEPLGIMLAAFALIQGFRFRSNRIIRLSIWLGISLLVAVFYRQPAELVWVILPLLILGARELWHSSHIYPEERVEVAVVSGAMMILLVYIWFSVANIGLNPYEQFNATTMPILGRAVQLPTSPRYIILFGAMLILIVCVSLIALGWSPRTARISTVWSLSLFFGVYAIASAWGASGMRTPGGVELWTQKQTPVHAGLLTTSVEDISLISRGHILAQPVVIMGVDSPALGWALRDHDVRVVSVLDPSDAPPIIITPIMEDLGLPSAYRGQDFSWGRNLAWDTAQAPDWIRWLVFRQLPAENESIILWARDDLFPDARENSQQP